ncbi:GDSL-type esterase/lipase family protein [Pedobacter duraquae]|uniref:Putative secreted protein (Por secretion system target) n=1 Tax=Pedobacter duraquae TaxID=425511 RepID=A0A4R6IS79_9SPHI|nr:GDSL-type esterase/lipase family protein [Pedobacter duraquae]TDO24725.1 putative secreted protein (Por secretion system target) [Pedobacter duraquae]
MAYRALAICIALFFISFTKLSAQTVSCPETAQYYAKDSVNIVTFGASTVQGVNGLNFQTYLTGFFVKCYTNKTINISNYGIAGQTTAQGLARLDDAIIGKTGFIIINMGINDALAIVDKKLTITETQANMTEIVERSLAAGLVPIMCTLQNVDDRTDVRNRNANVQIRLLNAFYRTLVTKYKLTLADINGVIRRDFSLYQDPFHPNARGYSLMAYVLFDTVNKIIADRFLQFTVTQNYPNPAGQTTNIDIILPEADKVTVKIYDLRGKLVQTPLDEYLNNGKHIVPINLSLLAAGMYIYRVTTESGLFTATKKLIVAH